MVRQQELLRAGFSLFKWQNDRQELLRAGFNLLEWQAGFNLLEWQDCSKTGHTYSAVE